MSSAVSSTEAGFSRRHILASRNFRLLWLGQAISTFGDKFTEIAIPILVYSLTGSAVQLGLAFLVQTVAALIFGLVAGVMSDRWNRQRTMIGADVIRSGLVWGILIIPFLAVPVSIQLGLLYTLSFAAAAVKQFFVPAKIATIPETVEEHELMTANSLDQSTMTLVGFFGFFTAGLMVEWAGSQTAFVMDGATFLLSALFIALMRLPAAEAAANAAPKEGLRASIGAGFSQVRAVPILKGTLLLSLLAPLALGATQALLLIFATEVLHTGAFGFGLLEGTFGVGIAFGALVLGRYAVNIPRGRLLAVGVIGMGVGQFLAVLVPLGVQRLYETSSVWLMTVSLPFFFLGAACNAAVFIGIRTIIQENAPREMIGRVFSVIMVVSSVAMALGASTAGLSDQFGVAAMLLVWSVVLVFSGLAAFTWRAFREAA